MNKNNIIYAVVASIFMSGNLLAQSNFIIEKIASLSI
jgi:hypothetical protein